MPKFLSDLEVQGKINAASAEIEDLSVGKLKTTGGELCVDSITIGDNIIKEGYYGAIAIEKGSADEYLLLFSEGEKTALSVIGGFCVNGDVKLGGGTLYSEASVFLDNTSGSFCIDVPNTFEIKANDTFLTRGTFHLGGWNDHPTGYFLGSDGHASLKSLGVGTDVACVGSDEFRAVKLCGTTALGACAYGISVSPTTGLQLWGTHFLRGSVWSDDTLKVVHNDLSLGATDKAFLGFDYANEVNFRTFPNDGTEATYCFVANQWENDSHKYYKPAGVRLKKANQVSEISDEDVLNVGEGDQRWVPTNLACRSVDIITNACLQDPACSYGVRLGGNGSDVPIWVRGDACVAGWLTIEPRFGCSSSSAQGVISAQWSQFRVDTSNDFCICAISFSFTPLNSQGGIEAFSISGSGALFKTCTTFDKDIYTKEKVYLTNLPTYSGSAEPENTSLVTKSYVDNRLSSVYSFKGTKAKVSDLKSITTKAKGDVYNVTEDGMNYAWDGTAWDALGGDFSRYYTKTEIDSTFAKTSGGNTFEGTQSFNGNAFFFGDAVFCTSKRVGLQNGKGAADLVFVNDTDKPQLSFKSEKINTEVILDVSRSGTLALAGDVAKLKENNTFSGHNTFGTVLGGTFCVGTSDIEKLHIFCISDGDSAYRWGNHHVEIYREPAGTREPTLGRLAFCFFGEDGDTGVFMSPSKGGTLAVVEEVYDRATIDGVTTGANVLPKMNEVIGYLEDYEEKTGEKLPLELYEETVKAIEEWQKDPTATKEWVTTSSTESTNPYYETPPTKPVVDLSVNKAEGKNPTSGFNVNIDESIFLPNAVYCNNALIKTAKFNKYLILPSARNVEDILASTLSYNKPLFLPSAVSCKGLLYNNSVFSCTVYLPNAKVCTYLLSNAKSFNHSLNLPNCSNATYGFLNTAMSAENISATLDSLPAWTDGAPHVITFTGSPGASELNQSSPSVAAAVAKGWTVEL